MTVRTATATFDMKKLLMIDRLVDGTVLVILEDEVPDAQRGHQGRRPPQRQLTLTGASADQAWRQVRGHATTLARRTVGSDADC